MPNATLKRWNGTAWVEILTTPASHTHPISDVTNLQTTLNTKANYGSTANADSTFIFRTFSMLEGVGTQYILLCGNTANNDVNGHIDIDRTTGNYQAARLDVIVTSGTSFMYGGSLTAHQAVQTAYPNEEKYDLVTLTYNSTSYVAIRYTGNTFPATISRFTGRLVSSVANALLVVDGNQVSNVAVFNNIGKFNFNTANVEINENVVWHAGNDGTGSGLDADLLDGNHASAFALASHSHAIADVTGLQTELDAKIPLTQKAAANGVATLDANTKIPLAQLPDAALTGFHFIGTMTGATDLLDLVDGTGIRQGDFYVATTSLNITWTDDPDNFYIVNPGDEGDATSPITLEAGDMLALAKKVEISASETEWTFSVINNNDPRFANYLPLTGGTISGQLTVSSGTYPPLLSIRTTTATTGIYGSHNLLTSTTGDMANTFGSGAVFSIRDSADVINPIAFVGAQRSGADNSGRLTLHTYSAGVSTEKMTILPNGNILAAANIPDNDVAVFAIDKLSVLGNLTVGSGTGYIRPNTLVNGPGGAIRLNASNTTADQFLAFGVNATGGSINFTELMRITSSGNVGIGTISPQDRLTVSGTLTGGTSELGIINTEGGKTIIRAGITGVSNNGTTFVTANSDGTNENIRMVINSAGIVGIGTTAPGVINGTAFAGVGLHNVFGTQGRLVTQGTGSAELLLNDSGATADQRIKHIISDGGVLHLGKTTDGGVVTNHLSILDNGNVGIGTTSPSEKLNVDGGIRLNADVDLNIGYYTDITTKGFGNLIINNHGDFAFGLNLKPDTEHDLVSEKTHSSIAGSAIVLGGNSHPNGTNTINFYSKPVGSTTAGTVYTAESAEMVLKQGNLGIGTTSPSYKLTIVDSADTNLYINKTAPNWSGYDSGAHGIRIAAPNMGNTSNLAALEFGKALSSLNSAHIDYMHRGDGSTSNYLSLGLFAKDEILNIAGTGNVGIGTTAPANLLHVKGNGASINIDRNTDSYGASLLLSENGVKKWEIKDDFDGSNENRLQIAGADNTVRLTIAQGGNVGIGTATPAEKLQVIGKTFLSGGSSAWNETTPGQARGTLHLGEASATSNVGTAITFGARDSSSGTIAQAGIYTRTDGTYGTNMYLATTDSYASGSKSRLKITSGGNVGINENSPSAQLQVKSGATNRASLIVDTLASHATDIASFRINNTTTVRFDSGNRVRANTFANLDSFNNANIDLVNNGPVISRNQADTNPALIVNLANAGATGDILKIQKEGSDIYAFTHDGTLKAPATFTIDPSAHGDATGKVIILGDLQVDGTTTTINSTTLEVDDKNIELSKGAANKAASDGAGISIDLGTDGTASLLYGSTADEFTFNKGLNVSGQVEISSANANSIETTTTNTNDFLASLILRRTTSADMADGFGSNISFQIKDSANDTNLIADLGAVRSGADNSGRLVFRTRNAGTTTEKMTILPNGNVGIGTTSPVSNLEVKSTGITQLTITGGSSTGFPLLQLSDEEAGGSNWNIENGREGDGILGFYNGTGGGNKVAITQDGKVGIGTSAPLNKLEVRVTGGDSNDGLIITRDDTTTTTDEILGGIGFDSTDGNVPSSILEASAYIAAFAAEDHSTGDKGGYLTFGTAPIDQDDDTVSIERMRITSSGTVGIGTTTTPHLLTVNGNVGASGFYATDRIVFGDIVSYDTPYIGWNGSSTPTQLRIADPAYEDPIIIDTESVSVSANKFIANGTISIGSSLQGTATVTTTSTTQTLLSSYAVATYATGKFMIQATSGGNRHVSELLVTHNGTVSTATEYGILKTAGNLFTVTTDISGTDVRILVTSASATSTVYRTTFTLIGV